MIFFIFFYLFSRLKKLFHYTLYINAYKKNKFVWSVVINNEIKSFFKNQIKTKIVLLAPTPADADVDADARL